MPNPFVEHKKTTAPSTPTSAHELQRDTRVAPYKPAPHISVTDPENPSDGDHWVRPDVNVPANSTTPEIRHQIDGTTYKAPLQDASQPSPDSTPIGALMMYAGGTQPPDLRWLVCDGSLLNRADYPDLFNVLSTSYNTGGEAGTQFRLPDMRSRLPVGAGAGAGLTSRAIGVTAGEENHTLSTTEMPSHSHSGSTSSDSHSHGGSTTSDSHSHTYTRDNSSGEIVSSGVGAVVQGQENSDANAGTTSDSHSHSVSTSSDSHSHTVSIGSAGSGGAHNNMPPVLTVNFIVRALP